MAAQLGEAWAEGVKSAGKMDYMGEQNLLNDIIRGPGWHRLMPPMPGQAGPIVYSHNTYSLNLRLI